MAKTTFKEAALRAVAILGLIAILLLGAWGIIQLAFFISSLFSNAGGAVSTVTTPVAHETITTNIPADATAGTPVTIGWNHQGGSGDYSFALSYSCAAGVTFKAPLPTGSSQSVPCDTPFNYTQAQNSLSITPVYAGSTDAKVTITIVATNLSSGAVTAQASGTMTVHPKAVATTPAKTTTTKTSSTGKSSGAKTTYVASSHRYTSLYGYPDLAVTITSAYSQNGQGVLQFVIQNVGTNVTPANWTFLATLPSGYQYPSGPQQALYPGDKIVYSMGYSDYGNSAYGYNGYGYNPSGPSYVGAAYNPWTNCGGAYGYGCTATPYGGYARTESVSVTVDPYNQMMEAFKGNNTASATFPAY